MPKLIPGSTKWQQPQPSINWSKSQKQKHCNKKWNVFKVNNKEAITTSMVSLFLSLLLTFYILMFLLLTLNIFHISHDVKNAEICALYCKKEIKFNKLQIEVFFLSNIIPPSVYKHPTQIYAHEICHLSVYMPRAY